MSWRRAETDYAIRSECGGWQISRTGRPGFDEQFTLWRRDPGTGACTWVGTYDSAAAAKARAVEDASG